MFIIVWKVAMELVRPKYMISSSRSPQLVQKAPFVAFLNPDVVETPPDVEFHEKPSSLQMVDKMKASSSFCLSGVIG
jgi:hypothetical protein